MSNPIDNKYAFVEEVVPGVIPATPTWTYLDVTNGGGTINYELKELSSDTMKQNRAAAGIRKVAGSASGSLGFEHRRDVAIVKLMQAGYSAGAPVAGKYIASNVDKSFTFEQSMNGEAGKLYFRYKNQHVSKLNLAIDAEGKASLTVDFTGGGMEHSTSIVAGATYAASEQGQELAGLDSGTINIGGLTARYLSLELTVEQAREAAFALGERDAVSIGTNANRVVKLTAKAFRKDLEGENLFISDTPVPVDFTLGSGENGFGFDFPAMVGSVPKSEMSGAKNIVTVTLTAQYDPTAGYDAAFTLLS